MRRRPRYLMATIARRRSRISVPGPWLTYFHMYFKVWIIELVITGTPGRRGWGWSWWSRAPRWKMGLVQCIAHWLRSRSLSIRRQPFLKGSRVHFSKKGFWDICCCFRFLYTIRSTQSTRSFRLMGKEPANISTFRHNLNFEHSMCSTFMLNIFNNYIILYNTIYNTIWYCIILYIVLYSIIKY